MMIDDYEEMTPERWRTLTAPARPRQRAAHGSRVTVQDYPIRPRRNQSAILSRRALKRTGPWFERLVAVILLAGSYAGTMIMCSGGLPVNLLGAAVGAGIQSLCTYIEWTYHDEWKSSIWLWIAVIADIGSTMGGYGPLIYDSIQALMPTMGGVVVWGIIGLISVMVAVVPETILID